jgi:TonB-linked SusC/RagA family outer membrane protein
VLCAVGLMGFPLFAQDTSRVVQLAAGGPRFWSAPAPGDPTGARRDVRDAAVFRTTIAVDFRAAPLRVVLAEIARQSGLRISVSPALVPLETPVTFSAPKISVGAALTAVLFDDGVDIQLSDNGRLISIAPQVKGPAAAPTRSNAGTITGVVSDSITGATVPYVIVRLDDAGATVTASAQGRYTLVDVTPGQHSVTARRVGYLPRTRSVVVEDGKVSTLDFRLNQPPTKLDEVVTTAVGDQRRYQVGNSIATINVDSIAPTTPVTSLTDLISARAPGVEVLETGGMTGSGEAIRIRGLSSLVLQNDPILIVDGVRQDNSAGGDVRAAFLYGAGGTHPTPTRLNDLDFSDIETVDILKGPAASTEYGTDAANGVIVITTKRGTAGRTQWHLSAEQTESDIPVTFPNNYYSWGHSTDGKNTPVECPLIAPFYSPYGSTEKTCAVDSVTQWSPLNHKATSLFGTGTRAKYDASVSGGTDAVRYYVSGGLSNETGIVRMPSVFRELADTANVGLPSAAYQPNSEQERSVRVNTAIRLGSTADLSATGSYLANYQQTPDASGLYENVLYAPGRSDAANYYGYGPYTTDNTPFIELSQVGSQNTNRVTGGLTASWRPTGWFVGHATVGLDHGSQEEQAITYPLANATYQSIAPGLNVFNGTTDIYSADLRGSATASLARDVRAVTSAGLQMVDTRTAGQSGTAFTLSPENLTLNGATGATVTQVANRQATLGGYGEEQLGFADRLFVTGAIRVDAGSGFGHAYSTAAYPKASVSFLAINSGPTTLRVRGAFGESGVQPANGAALQLYVPYTGYLGGAAASTNVLSWPGNPNLQPERSVELEGGVDFGGWGNRVTVELTGYSKTTHDALVDVNTGATLGNYTYEENIGEVRNTGVEGTVTAAVIQSRSVTWDVGVNASVNHNTLLTLAPGVLAQVAVPGGGFGPQYRQTPGYPLYGIWGPKVTYADKNHDGIIESNEVTQSDSAMYLGSSLPTQEVSFTTHVGLFGGAVTVGALVDYRGGYKIANEVAAVGDEEGHSRGANDPHAPLWLQARSAAQNTFYAFNSLDVEDGSFIRFRELSLTYALPHSLVRLVRAQSLSLTAAVRNLALWTRYTGPDPEASNGGQGASNIQSAPTSNGLAVNNDVRGDFGAVPLARYWVVRLNVGI